MFCPPSYGGGAARCGRARVRAACARQSGLRAVWAAPGASWRRKPGRRAGFLGPPSDCWGPGRRPRWATGGVRPLGRTVGPVTPDPAAKTGNSRRAGGCGPCPVDNLWQHGNMATWQHGLMASWQHGNMATWPHGLMASWPHGGLASWPHGLMASWPHGLMASWHRGIVASVSLRRRCPSWNGEPTVNAGGEMSEIAEVELTRHRVVASSADTVRRCFRQILAGWAIATKLCGILGRWTWTEPRFKSLHLL